MSHVLHSLRMTVQYSCKFCILRSNVDCDREEDIHVPGFFSITPCHTHIGLRVRCHTTLNYEVIQSQPKLFEDAKSVVRKYIAGTRSRHGKITSIVRDQEATRPDKKGLWTIKGASATEESGKEQFVARVTSGGEVLMTNLTSHDIRRKSP